MEKFTKIIENNNYININSCLLNSELVYIQEANNQVGSLILCYNNYTNKANIFSVSVLEKHRGKQYGKKLVEKAIEISKNKGYEYIELSTELNNNIANNLYKSLGFEKTEIKDGYNNYVLKLK